MTVFNLSIIFSLAFLVLAVFNIKVEKAPDPAPDLENIRVQMSQFRKDHEAFVSEVRNRYDTSKDDNAKLGTQLKWANDAFGIQLKNISDEVKVLAVRQHSLEKRIIAKTKTINLRVLKVKPKGESENEQRKDPP